MVITDHFDHVIDDKNRLAIPSQIRNSMDKEQDGEFFYLVPRKKYLQLIPEKAFIRNAAQHAAGIVPPPKSRQIPAPHRLLQLQHAPHRQAGPRDHSQPLHGRWRPQPAAIGTAQSRSDHRRQRRPGRNMESFRSRGRAHGGYAPTRMNMTRPWNSCFRGPRLPSRQPSNQHNAA